MEKNAQVWTDHKFSGLFWRKVIFHSLNALPRLFVDIIVVFVAAIFLLLLTKERRATKANLQHINKYKNSVFGKTNRLYHTYRVFLNFAWCISDALRHIGPKKLPLHVDGTGRDFVERAISGGKGAILLTMHIGSWEIAGSLLTEQEYPINIVMAPEEDEYTQAQELLDKARKGHKIKIIHVTKDRVSTLNLLRALKQNELLAIQGDRLFGDASMVAPVFGSPARLPIGAISLALASGAPIIPSVTVRVGPGRYSIVARDPVHLKRTTQDKETNIRNGLAQVVKEMEAFLKEYHLQWFNFFKFWEEA